MKPEYPADCPEIAVWVTVGKRDHVIKYLPKFIEQCTYPNYKLLISHEDNPLTADFIQSLKHPRKQVLVGPRMLAGKYAELLEHTESYFYSIQDDWDFLCDPGPMMRDAVTLLEAAPQIVMVRMTCHTPIFIDVLHRRFQLFNTVAGPVALGMGLTDMQTVVHKRLFDAVPNLWPPDMDFYEADGHWQHRIRLAGFVGTVMLRYWGCNVHAGPIGDRGWETEENRLNQREAVVLKKYRMFGLRPPGMLYSTSLNEEQRREFIYPLFMYGEQPLVPNHIPLSAQLRLGSPRATQVV